MTGSPPDSLPEDLGSSQAEQPPRVLYPYRESDAHILFETALGIADAHDAELFIVTVDTGDEGVEAHPHNKLASELLDLHVNGETDVPIEHRTLTGETPARAITKGIDAFDIDAVVVSEGWDLTGQIRKHVDCDIVAIDPKRTRSVGSILAAVAGGPHSGGIVDVAGALATANDAWVEFLYVRTDDEFPDDRGETLIAAAKERLPDVETDGRVLDGDDPTETIVDETEYYDVTVIGAPRKGRLAQFVFGSTTTDIRGRAKNTVVTVRRGDAPDRTLFSDFSA